MKNSEEITRSLMESVDEVNNAQALNEEIEISSNASSAFADDLEDMLSEEVIDGQDIEVPSVDKNIDALQFFNQDNLGAAVSDTDSFDVDHQTDNGNAFVSKDNRKGVTAVPTADGEGDDAALSEMALSEDDLVEPEDSSDVEVSDSDFSDDEDEDDDEDFDDYDD